MQATTFLVLVATVFASLALAGVLVLTSASHGRYTMDFPGAVQKVHSAPTPRVGGLGIYVALWVATCLIHGQAAESILRVILIAGTPALIAGLAEDVTKRAGIRGRLLATGASGLLAVAMTGAGIDRLDVALLDPLFSVPLIAVAFTAFAVAGLANAVNIIDGFHGLASGVVTLSLLCIAIVATAASDPALAIAAITVAAALVGFWMVNFPWGKLFLGDGGAYFAGFALGWLAVLLPLRNPSVSPWASLLICGYPVTEAVYSIVRRWRVRQSPAHPDSAHLHSLIASRIVRRQLRGLDPTLQNAAVSIFVWICAAVPAFVGVTFYGHTPWLALGALACIVLYHWLYRFLARP